MNGPDGVTPLRKRKNHRACIHCAKAHTTCGTERPCVRCVKKRLQDSCVDQPRKKSKYLADDLSDGPRREGASAKNSRNQNQNMLSQSRDDVPHHNRFEQQYVAAPQHIVHKPVFQSSAIDSEYSSLSNILHRDFDNTLNKIPVNILNNSSTQSQYPFRSLNEKEHYNNAESSDFQSNGNMNFEKGKINETDENVVDNKIQEEIDSHEQRKLLANYLGDRKMDVLNDLDINIFEQHYPLVPIKLEDAIALFPNQFNLLTKSETPVDDRVTQTESSETPTGEGPHTNNNRETGKLSNESKSEDVNAKEIIKCRCDPPSYITFQQKANAAYGLTVNNEDKLYSNKLWPHSLQYQTPAEIYEEISQPFLQTHGFSSLLEYLKFRFNKKNVIMMCKDLSEIIPILIAGFIDLKEEDMIFLEHSYQRTLLQYTKFINQVGTPTVVWRRNGQISYINDEFCLLTGWSREIVLGKMSFIVELFDDDSCLEYFKNFKSICYSDYTGSKSVSSLKVLSPIKDVSINCTSWWTLKRDVFGLPLMIIATFIPRTEE